MNRSLINNSLTNSSITKKDSNDNNDILDLILEVKLFLKNKFIYIFLTKLVLLDF